MKYRAANSAWLLLSLAIIGFDQATKAMVIALLQPYQPVEITSFFNFTLAYNDGAAFSFLSNAGGWQRWLLIGIAIIVGLILLHWLLKLPEKRKWLATALSLMLGGAIGNIIDRFQHGHVTDFLDFHIAGWHWPFFNLADTAICIGAIMLIIDIFRR